MEYDPNKILRLQRKWNEFFRVCSLGTKYERAAVHAKSKPSQRRLARKAARYRNKQHILARRPM